MDTTTTPSADGTRSAPWLLASIGAATVIMLFSWFGGFVSWHEGPSGPFDGPPVLTLSGFKPHGTRAAHAVHALTDRTLCIGPYDVAPWTASRAAALALMLLGSLASMRLVLARLVGLGPRAAASATSTAAARLVASWIVPMVVLFLLGAVAPMTLLMRIGIVWAAIMALAFTPLQVALRARAAGTGGVFVPTLVQVLAGAAWLVASVQVAGALVAAPAPAP